MTKVNEALRLSGELLIDTLQTPVPGLSELTSYLAQSTGKSIRSLLLLTAAADFENKVHDDAIRAAACIELLHMATLIHDDVMDNADTRRGLPALHQKFGTKSAVICGDFLLSQSMLMFASIDTKRLEDIENHAMLISHISKALAGVCKGEYLQHANFQNLELNLRAYLKIISGKTAALFSASAYIGAIIGGESAKTANELRRFGRFMGITFQIADDCNDYELTEAQALKPVGSDIKNGVITLPLILAMRKTPELREFAKEIMESQTDAKMFVKSVRDSGGAGMARDIAGRYNSWAFGVLQNVSPQKKDALLAILQKINI